MPRRYVLSSQVLPLRVLYAHFLLAELKLLLRVDASLLSGDTEEIGLTSKSDLEGSETKIEQ